MLLLVSLKKKKTKIYQKSDRWKIVQTIFNFLAENQQLINNASYGMTLFNVTCHLPGVFIIADRQQKRERKSM